MHLTSMSCRLSPVVVFIVRNTFKSGTPMLIHDADAVVIEGVSGGRRVFLRRDAWKDMLLGAVLIAVEVERKSDVGEAEVATLLVKS